MDEDPPSSALTQPSGDESEQVAMSREEVDDFLTDRGTGILSFSAQGEAYAVPESFGYVDGTLYFQLADHDDSRKMEFLEQTRKACFATYDMDSADEWASVVVRGELSRVSEPAHGEAAGAVADNGTIPGVSVFGPSLDHVSFDWYKLEPAEVSGRKGPQF